VRKEFERVHAPVQYTVRPGGAEAAIRARPAGSR
jgi:hypothetical protein